jgi:methionine-rich copper-binding protein CopC
MSLRRRLTLVLLLAMGAGVAELVAHLNVVRTSPANASTIAEAPARVQVWFSQQPAPRVSRLDLAGPAGAVPLGELQVDAKERSLAASVLGTLAPGRYEVTWRTAGDDGHVQRGTFSFTLTSGE